MPLREETILVVDVGGTKILTGEVDRNGQLLRSIVSASDLTDQTTAFQLIEQAIRGYLATEPVGEIQAIGVDTVGIVNQLTGAWEEIDRTKQQHVPMAYRLHQEFKFPVFAGNDVFCATLAEQRFGLGQRTQSFIYLNVGTGIGGRIVDRGQVLNGPNYNGGEFGHMTVDMNSDLRCLCGRTGCVEPIASGLGMSDRAKELLAAGKTSQLRVEASGRIGAKQLFAAYDASDAVAVRVVDQALRGLSAMITSLVRIANPEGIVLGGGVASDGWLLDHLLPRIDPVSTRFLPYGITASDLDPNYISSIGAAVFAFQRMG